MKLENGTVTRNPGIAIKNVESAMPHSYILSSIQINIHFITKNVMPTIQGISGIMTIHTSGDFLL